MKLLTTLFIYLTITTYATPNDKEGKFKIYCFDKSIVEYGLSMYEYDSTWINFMLSTDLKKASIIISDNEIENYDWEKQEVSLTNPGVAKLKDLQARNNYLSHVKFIVTLDDKRIYAGEFLSLLSQMAIQHPIIQYDIGEFSGKENIIRICPMQVISGAKELPQEIQVRTEKLEVKNYFKTIGKLK